MVFQEPMTSLDPTMRCGCTAVQRSFGATVHQRAGSQARRAKVSWRLFEEVQLTRSCERAWSAYPHMPCPGGKSNGC